MAVASPRAGGGSRVRTRNGGRGKERRPSAMTLKAVVMKEGGNLLRAYLKEDITEGDGSELRQFLRVLRLHYQH